jgi:hypothetical protein
MVQNATKLNRSIFFKQEETAIVVKIQAGLERGQ